MTTTSRTSKAQALLYNKPAEQASLNEPVDLADAMWTVQFRGPYGAADGTHCLDRNEVEQYNADPDGFAAKELGFASADEYREWVEARGYALCSERTKSGKLCRNPVLMKPGESWSECHRSRPCASHGRGRS
jgi:hypothetical protein